MTAVCIDSQERRHHNLRPAGISRVALHAGLALVAWGRRSSNRLDLNNDDVIARHLFDQEAIDREASKVTTGPIFLGI